MSHSATQITKLVTDHSDALLRFFRASRIPYADATDFVQATFEVYLNKKDKEIEQPGGYLWGIARRKVLQYHERHRTSEEYRSSRIPPPSATSPSTRLDRSVRVQTLLHRLENEARTVFLLRCEGLSIDAIAEAIDKSKATVNRRLKDARAEIERVAAEDPVSGIDPLSVADVEDSYCRD